MTIQFTKQEDIDRIVNIVKKYKEQDFVFTNYYYYRIKLRDISHEFLLKTFFAFEKIKLIEQDVLSRGDIGYDLYYEIEKNRTLIIGVAPKGKLIFIHGILRYRNWLGSVKKKE